MDGKYGRLYTADDVAEIASLVRQYEREDQSLRRPISVVVADLDAAGRLSFPADEPLFLLRGQDVVTPEAIARYVTEAAIAGASVEHREAAAEAGRYIAGWQHANAERIKVPD